MEHHFYQHFCCCCVSHGRLLVPASLSIEWGQIGSLLRFLHGKQKGTVWLAGGLTWKSRQLLLRHHGQTIQLTCHITAWFFCLQIIHFPMRCRLEGTRGLAKDSLTWHHCIMFSVCIKHFSLPTNCRDWPLCTRNAALNMKLTWKTKSKKGFLSTSTLIESQEHPEYGNYSATVSTWWVWLMPHIISELQCHKSSHRCPSYLPLGPSWLSKGRDTNDTSCRELGTLLGSSSTNKENVLHSFLMSGLLLYVGVQIFMALGAVRK